MNLLAKYTYIYIYVGFFFIFPTRVPRGEGKWTLSQCRDSIYSISRPSRLNIDVAAWRTQDGRESDCVDIYIYIRFQWTTGCIEEEIVIASDRSDRKLVCIASLCILCRRNRVTMNDKRVRGLFEFLAALSALQNRGNDSFFLHRFDEFFSFFFFKLEIKEGTK